MRPITGDCACGAWFMQTKRGALRIYCDTCRRERARTAKGTWQAENPGWKKRYNSDWYARNRKNNPQWRAINKKRAKAWRAKNREHIRSYQRAQYEARA